MQDLSRKKPHGLKPILPFWIVGVLPAEWVGGDRQGAGAALVQAPVERLFAMQKGWWGKPHPTNAATLGVLASRGLSCTTVVQGPVERLFAMQKKGAV